MSTQVLNVNTESMTGNEEAFVSKFKTIVIGQDAANEVALDVYRNMTNPLRDKTKPIGIYYLVGPSRTGKTLTPEAVAAILHGSKDSVTRIHMSDYSNEAQLLDLKGAPPMYVGYQDPAKLKLNATDVDPTSVISNHNLKRVRLNSKIEVDVIILDEFEKGNEDVYKLFMGIFDKGELRLGNGVVVNLTNAVFFLTSNIGMDTLARKMSHRSIGFTATQTKVEMTEDSIREAVQTSMRERFKPEFINRLDMIAIYKPLPHDDTLKIVDSELEIVRERIARNLPAYKIFELLISDSAKEFLVAEAKKDGGSVANLKRVIQKHVVNPLGREINSDSFKNAKAVRIEMVDGKLVFVVDKVAFEISSTSSNLPARMPGRLVLKKRCYKVTATAERFEDLYEVMGMAMHDMKEIFGALWTKMVVDRKSNPCKVEFIVYGLPTQMKNFEVNYPEFKIEDVSDSSDI